MSLTLIRRLVLAGALSAAFLGAGLAQAEDEPPAEVPVEVAVAAPSDIGPTYEEKGDFVYSDVMLEAKGKLETALTSVLGGCRPGLVAARVAVITNEVDPASGYVLVTEISEFGRANQEKLSAAMLDVCFDAMDVSTIDKAALDEHLATIESQMEALLALA